MGEGIRMNPGAGASAGAQDAGFVAQEPSGGGKAYVAAQAITAISQLAGGLAGRSAYSSEAEMMEEQARIAQEEARIEAMQRARDVGKFQQRQASTYLASGVTLEGTPVIVMEETRQQGQAEVDAILRRGAAQARLAEMKAKQHKNAGRNSLISSLLGVTATGLDTYINGKKYGLWGDSATGNNTPKSGTKTSGVPDINNNTDRVT